MRNIYLMLRYVIFFIHISFLMLFFEKSSFADFRFNLCLSQEIAVVQHDEIQADAEDMLRRVQIAIGLADSNIKVIECAQAEKLFSYVSDGKGGIAAGKYVVFNPVWLREVAGSDRVQEIALFGHELGHILNDDFGARKDLPVKQKEADADHFAGCAVARLQGNWSSLENLLSRLRSNISQVYPDRLASLNAAKQGFESCGGGEQKIVPVASECPSGYTIIDDAIAEGNGGCGFSIPMGAPLCMVHTRSSNNVGCGFEVRDSKGQSSAARACRIMLSLNNDDPRNYDYPMGPDKVLKDCARRAEHDGGKYARVKCNTVYGPIFDLFDRNLDNEIDAYIPKPNCGW